MKTKRIIDIGFGKRTLYELLKSTKISSRHQYGLAQLEDKYTIFHVSLEHHGIVGTLKNNLKVLGNYDIVFMIYLYLSPLMLLSLLRVCGLYRKRKIIVISHRTLVTGHNSFEKLCNRLIYSTCNKVLFHSQKNLEESINKGLIRPEQAEFLYWGDDLEYIDTHIHSSQGEYFLSTGREQRDFSLLVSAFSKTDAKLELYTNKINYDNNYEYLFEMQELSPNIKIVFVEKDMETIQFLSEKSAECMCIIIPLLQTEIHYCVGLTSIVEAMAMGKPIICSRNPYSPIDIEKERIGIVVDDEVSWIKAINWMKTHPIERHQMGIRARKLAEQKFNINKCSKQLDRLFNQ